jgi:hypothetical protein
MAALRNPVADRRTAPRKKVHLDCQVLFEGNEHDAVIQDISIMSALLWSSFMPPHDSVVSIRLKPSISKPLIILNGNVVRCDSRYKDHGKVGAFAVTFKNNSPATLQSLSRVVNPQIRSV